MSVRRKRKYYKELAVCDADTPDYEVSGVWVAKVVDVYDGDTITVCFDAFPGSRCSGIRKFKVRMYGYDSPEMRPKKKKYPDEAERQRVKAKARVARDALRKKVLGQMILLKGLGAGDEENRSGRSEKWGRLLGLVYELGDQKIHRLGDADINRVMSGDTINKWMVDGGYGVEYFGGTKN